jgi:hypothetical protein
VVARASLCRRHWSTFAPTSQPGSCRGPSGSALQTLAPQWYLSAQHMHPAGPKWMKGEGFWAHLAWTTALVAQAGLVVLLGDFNACICTPPDLPGALLLGLAKEARLACTSYLETPTRLQVVAGKLQQSTLDYIFASPALCQKTTTVKTDSFCGSDHSQNRQFPWVRSLI